MLSSKALKDIVFEARPIIERQLDDATRIAGFRDVVASSGGDWGALKALIKAQIQDERDETGDGKRVKKILEKADFSTGYADMLGWSNMNEKNFSADEDYDRETGEVLDRDARRRRRTSEAMDDHKSLVDEMADAGLISEEARLENKALADAVATKFGNGPAHQSPRKAAEAVSERTAIQVDASASAEAGVSGQPEMIPAASAESAGEIAGNASDLPTNSKLLGGFSVAAAETNAEETGEDGIVNVVTGGESAEMDRATEGSFETGSEAAEKGREAIPAGPEGVDLTHAGAGESPATDQPLPAKPKFVLRPYCRKPGEGCGGSGTTHCHSCLKAREEVAA